MIVHKGMFVAERLKQAMLLVVHIGITFQGICPGHYTYFVVRDIKRNSTVLCCDLSEQIPATLGRRPY